MTEVEKLYAALEEAEAWYRKEPCEIYADNVQQLIRQIEAARMAGSGGIRHQNFRRLAGSLRQLWA